MTREKEQLQTKKNNLLGRAVKWIVIRLTILLVATILIIKALSYIGVDISVSSVAKSLATLTKNKIGSLNPLGLTKKVAKPQPQTQISAQNLNTGNFAWSVWETTKPVRSIGGSVIPSGIQVGIEEDRGKELLITIVTKYGVDGISFGQKSWVVKSMQDFKCIYRLP
ncbi:MAG: hypothetical protein ABIJ91_01895 [Candidatus Kuenenbacteria bacterium]